MSAEKITDQSLTGTFSNLQNKIEANWEKHHVEILTGAFIIGGALLIVGSAGVLALPVALSAALIASGLFAAGVGLGCTAYVSLQGAAPKTVDDDLDEQSNKSQVAVDIDPQVGEDPASSSPAPSSSPSSSNVLHTPEAEKEYPEFMGSDTNSLLFKPKTPIISEEPKSYAEVAKNSSSQEGVPPNSPAKSDLPFSEEPKPVVPPKSSIKTVSVGPSGKSLPDGALLSIVIPGFSFSSIAALEPKEKDFVEEQKNPPSSLQNDQVDEADLLLPPKKASAEKPSKEDATSLSSYIPSAAKTRKAVGYALATGMLTLGIVQGARYWDSLAFAMQSDPTLPQFGTTPNLTMTCPANALERSAQEGYSQTEMIINGLLSAGSYIGSSLYNWLPSARLSLAIGAPTAVIALTAPQSSVSVAVEEKAPKTSAAPNDEEDMSLRNLSSKSAVGTAAKTSSQTPRSLSYLDSVKIENDEIDDDNLLLRPSKEDAASLSSYIPSAAKTHRAVVYMLLAGMTILGITHAIRSWSSLSEDEKQAYLDLIQNGTEQVRQNLTNRVSSLDVFAMQSDPTLPQFGTTPNLNMTCPTDALERTAQEGHSLGEMMGDGLSFAGSFIKDSVSYAYNSLPSQEGIENWINDPNSTLENASEQILHRSNIAASEVLDDGQCSIFDEPVRRGYVEYYGSRLLNISSSVYNSLPSQEGIENWINDPNSTLGNTSEQILQKIISSDPIGSFTEQAETFVSTIGEYFNQTEPTPEALGIPVVDLRNTPADQLMVQQAYQELTTCSVNGPAGAIAADESKAFVDYLLSQSGK